MASDTTGPKRVHELKTWPDYWIALERGVKNFEIRRNDREFQPGDVLLLREWDPNSEEYTGRTLRRRINFVLRDGEPFGLAKGFAVLGLGDTTGPAPAITDERMPGDLRAAIRSQAERVVSAALAGRAVVELPDLGEALVAAGDRMATDPRDWSVDRRDAWLWGLLVGWECELAHEHDDLCGADAALREMANRHGWTDGQVACLRRYRAAVAAVQTRRPASESSGDGAPRG